MINIKVKKDLKLTFQYNQEVIDIIRSFPKKKYDPKDKSWSLPKDKSEDLTEKFKEQDLDYTFINNSVFFSPVKKQVPIIKDSLAEHTK